MFRVENNVPEIYITESRDFQLFARLYDLVFQTARQSIDSMEHVTNTMLCDEKLLPLLSTKLGFFQNLQLNDIAYRKTLSAFPHIIRHKGSKRAIELIVNLFKQLTNTDVDFKTDSQDKSKLIIKFVDFTPDFDLLVTLLEYVRPTGMIIEFEVKSYATSNSDFSIQNRITVTDATNNPNVYDVATDQGAVVGFDEVNYVE